MTLRLPDSLLARPIAHRALHDRSAGRPENSRAAARAAVEAGYGIEIDIQISADGQPMVFHDYDLDRLTGAKGAVYDQSAVALGGIRLTGGDEGIPTLAEFLAVVDGKVPLLIEIKDQDGALGPDVGPLEEAVADTLHGYTGDMAVMSFNPYSVIAMKRYLPEVPRGLTTENFAATFEWPISEEQRRRLSAIADYDEAGACFISHDHKHLSMPRVAELKAAGAHILCWTIRSPADETKARRVADNITFEDYLA